MTRRVIVGVLGLPVRKDRKVLLTQRHAPQNDKWHNKWQVAGGALDYGETTEACLEREMYEELRVKPKILYPHPITNTTIWYADEDETKMDSHILLLTYIVDIGDQTPQIDQDPDWETSDWGWFSLDEARKLEYLPATLRVVEDAFHIIDKNDIL